MKYLLDTNVFREVGKERPNANVRAWLEQVNDTDLAVSTLTVREIRKGIVRLRSRKPDVAELISTRVNGALAALDDRLLPVTKAIAELWGEMLAQREKHIDDTGLAATARVHRLVLVTRNLDHVTDRGADTLDPYQPNPRIERAPRGPGEPG